tara:strand:- start:248 stop:436 length:189 start_codon:yes stop_codon:yes gene_type:complete
MANNPDFYSNPKYFAHVIGKEAQRLRFKYGWNFDQTSKYLMEKYDLDFSDLDEMLQISEKEQ